MHCAIRRLCARQVPFARYFSSDMSFSPNSIAWITVPKAEDGDKVAEALFKEKLAACVNQIPGLTSLYMWEGKMCKDQEVLLMVKTRTELMAEVVECVKANHPYDCPEVISVPIEQGSAEYLQWIQDCTRPKN